MLGQALASGPFVLSYFFTHNQSGPNDCALHSTGAAWLSGTGQARPTLQTESPTGILCNLPVLQQSARYNGFINATPDDDGLFRRTPLVILFQDHLYPSLALQSFLIAKKLDRIVLSATDAGFVLKAQNLEIPLDQAGNLMVKFPSRGQRFETISAAEIMEHNIDDSRLRDRIVLIGFSATGLHEVRPTPNDPNFLGVEIHATVLDNLAREDFLHRPGYARKLELALATLIGFTLFIGLVGAGPAPIVMVHGLVIALLMSGSQFLLNQYGTLLSPAMPVLMAILTFLSLTLIKYARESLHTRQMNLMIARTQEGIIQSFSSMSEFRDPETGAHIKRTQNYVKALAQRLQNDPNFQCQLTDETIELFFKAAPLHDIGKVGIRDSILLKPSHLGMDEFEIMKSHPQIGADIIEAVAAQCGWNAFMRIAHQICLSHHEKWDGSGYPHGLTGAAIPLSARLMMLADVYDALISRRVYKPPFSHSQARTLIENGKGKHFDPVVVEAFLALEDQFIAIALEHLDSDDQRQTLLDNQLTARPS